MAETPKNCPKCKIEWGVQRLKERVPAEGDRPARGELWKCEACYHHWHLDP